MTSPASQVLRRRVVSLVILAALVVAARAPFLVRGDRFFDSDEAVEGLMARHVLRGEFPAYLWGQHYKGVPEVYLAAAVFGVAGPSVIALKATTLAGFVAFACLQFVLFDILFSTPVAWMASLFLVGCPPSLVLWSLSGSAELVMTLAAGAGLLLAWQRWQSTGSHAALVLAGGVIGFGLWVQQFLVYYLVALGLTALWQMPGRGAACRRFVRAQELRWWVRGLLHVCLAIAALYVLLGVVAFFTGGFEFSIAGILVTVRHAQKLWRIAAAVLLVWAGARWLGRPVSGHERLAPRQLIAPAVALLAGNAPALAHRFTGGGSAPIARMDVHGLAASLLPIAHHVVPILFGFESPTTERLPVSGWFALIIAAVVACSFLGIRRRKSTPFFHLFLLCTPVLFLVSGAYVDSQSYRYLMPLFAALPVVFALGIDAMARWNRLAAGVFLVALLAVFASQQVAWYERLRPDTEAQAIVGCLDERGIRYARAEYWLSYKLTFLTNERVIVAPASGPDRYPAFTEEVESYGAQAPAPILLHALGETADALMCDRLVVTQ